MNRPAEHLGAVIAAVSDGEIASSWIAVSSSYPGLVHIVLNRRQKEKAIELWPSVDGGVTISADLDEIAIYLAEIPKEHCEPWARYLEQLASEIRKNATILRDS